MRCRIGIYSSLTNNFAVRTDVPFKIKLRQICKIIFIIYSQPVSVKLCFYRLIDCLCLKRTRLKGSVMKNKSVTAEICVMSFLSEISAVTHSSVFIGCRMVCPFPYKSTYHVRSIVDNTPVISQITGAVAHSVAVFAPNERSCIPRLVIVVHYILYIGIHTAYNINSVRIFFDEASRKGVFVIIRLLVMYQPVYSV